MKTFLHGLTERNFRGRTVGLIENGSWAPVAAKVMKDILSGCRELRFTDTTVRIRSALDDTSRAQLEAMADELTR
jgi:flavorubredoxin